MEKCFHPISGEEVYLATKDEKAIIDIAIKYMMIHSSESGLE